MERDPLFASRRAPVLLCSLDLDLSVFPSYNYGRFGNLALLSGLCVQIESVELLATVSHQAVLVGIRRNTSDYATELLAGWMCDRNNFCAPQCTQVST